jgi:hypothetical protein
MSESGLLSLHVSAAVKHGLELFSYSQAIICEGFKTQFQQQVATCATEFALHARRISELNDLLGKPTPLVSLGQTRGGDVEKISIESDYNRSLNRLIHARTMSVHYVALGKPILFPNEGNYILSYLAIETDQRKQAYVSVFGISAHFLTLIAPAILEAIRGPMTVSPISV